MRTPLYSGVIVTFGFGLFTVKQHTFVVFANNIADTADGGRYLSYGRSFSAWLASFYNMPRSFWYGGRVPF